jgi:hypothetical protein
VDLELQAHEVGQDGCGPRHGLDGDDLLARDDARYWESVSWLGRVHWESDSCS